MKKPEKKSFSVNDVRFKHAVGKLDIYGNMFHDHYEIYLFIKGEVEFINPRLRKKLTPYEIVIIPPGEYHQFCVEGDPTVYERSVLDIYPYFLDEEILKNALSGKTFLIVPKNHRLVENFKYLSENIENEDFSYILPAVASDIVFLIKRMSGKTEKAQNNLDPLAERIMNYINENYLENITLNKIADRFFVSVSSVSHIFKTNFGTSIKKYIIDKKMNEARIALQNGVRPWEIAEKFGFENYSTFYRSYMKHFGVSPSETYKNATKKTFAL